MSENKSLTYDSEELDEKDEIYMIDMNTEDCDEHDDHKVKIKQSSRRSVAASSLHNGIGKHSTNKRKRQKKAGSVVRTICINRHTRNNGLAFFNRDMFKADIIEAAGMRYVKEEWIKQLFEA